jgi:Fic family protein
LAVSLLKTASRKGWIARFRRLSFLFQPERLKSPEKIFMKTRDEARVSSIHRAYARTADRALKRRRKSIKRQQTISEKIVYQLKRLETSTARDIARLVHLDVQTVREELQTLMASGMIEETPVGKTFRYRFIAAN